MPASSLKIIDPHLHLFNLDLGEYAWLKPQNPPYWPDKKKIAVNYSESDVQLTTNLALAGFVHIEAGFDNQQPWREIDWLESTCRTPFRTVAYADLTTANFNNTLQQLSQRKSVVGIRHILDDKALEILNNPHTNNNIAALNSLGLIFDAQLSIGNTADVEALIKVAKQQPNMAIIINHGGWPPTLGSDDFIIWQRNLRRLSAHPNIAIKLSAWEMHDRHWLFDVAKEILRHSLDCFGHTRLMLASNFPLCTLSYTYATLWQGYYHELQLTPELFQQLTYTNAARWYKFI